MSRLPIGIIRYRHGYRASVRVHHGPGGLLTKTFPLGTSLITMKAWREDQRAAARQQPRHVRPIPRVRDGFRADAARYLNAVRNMPTYTWREKDIDAWTAVFRDTPRRQITAADIRAQLATWAAQHSRRGKPFAASTLNHRRTALHHLWRVLDGPAAPNPVEDVPRFREPDPEPRGLPYVVVRQILEAMPDHGRARKLTAAQAREIRSQRHLPNVALAERYGVSETMIRKIQSDHYRERVDRQAQDKARIRVIAYTGLPPAQIAHLTAADIDVEGRTVYVRGRKKGRGTRGVRLPLTEDGAAALQALLDADALGPFPRTRMRTVFRRACAAVQQATGVDLSQARIYDFRHAFGTLLYQLTGDIRATQGLLLHASAKMTERYTLAAVDGRLLAAVRKVTPAGHTT